MNTFKKRKVEHLLLPNAQVIDFKMVPLVGLEPTRLAALDFESYRISMISRGMFNFSWFVRISYINDLKNELNAFWKGLFYKTGR